MLSFCVLVNADDPCLFAIGIHLFGAFEILRKIKLGESDCQVPVLLDFSTQVLAKFLYLSKAFHLKVNRSMYLCEILMKEHISQNILLGNFFLTLATQLML